MAKTNAKPNLGDKQACPECEKKFYDLAKRPAVCPYCTHAFDPADAFDKQQPLASNINDEEEEKTTDEEEDGDSDETIAKELELDGDSATFTSDDGDDGDDNGQSAPDMDGFSSSDDEEEEGNATTSNDEEEESAPPTRKEGEEEEEVEEVEI